MSVLNDLEREIVILKTVQELIDSIVNHAYLSIGDTDPTEIRFKSTVHGELFNIVLVDFLSKMDKNSLFQSDTYLGSLRKITDAPNFDVDNSVALLRNSVQQFKSWLDTPIAIEPWSFPDLDEMKLTRFSLVKIAGNICRHNMLRAVGIAEGIKNLFSQSDVDISLDQILLKLSELNDQLHDDIFVYHSSTITEFLNNIRWGIHYYLRPEFEKSIVYKYNHDERFHSYKYTFPNGIKSDFSKENYWELMNRIRSKPYFRRFEITEWIKKRY